MAYKLKVGPSQGLKLKGNAGFALPLLGGDVIATTKTGGLWRVDLDYSEVQTGTTVNDDTAYILTWDSASNLFTSLTVTNLKAEFQGTFDSYYATAAQGALADTAVQPAELGALAYKDSAAESDLLLSDVTTADVSTAQHGFAPKLPNDASKYFDGTGSYSIPAGAGGTFDYDSVSDATAATIAGTQNLVRTGGYAAAGDGGGALYTKVGSEPSHAGKFQSADGAWWELKATPADIRMFGASTAASGATNASAINSALAYSNDVYAPPGTFDIGATIVVGFRGSLRGAGRQQTFFNKTFNGDILQLGSAANMRHIALVGNGATYTGRGVTIGTGTGAQWITQASITDFNDYCVEYTAASAGTQGGIGEGTMLGRTTAGGVCVKYPDDALVASPRYLFGVITTGAYGLCDTNGAQNLFIVGCYCNSITFGTNAGKVLVWGTRIALVGASMTAKGSDLIVDGCAIAGDVDWQAGSGSSYGPNNILSGTFTDSTNSALVSKINHIATSFTPQWLADTVNPAIGNGTLAGQVSGHGKFRRYTVQVTMGSTTTYGTGPWYIPLKGSNEIAKTTTVGSVYGLDSGTAFRVGVCFIAAGDNKIRLVSENSGNTWSSALPHTWANSDYFKLCIDIELT